jgi:hypothetical protein
LSPLISLAVETPFLFEMDLDREDADLVCVGLSFLLLELCESDLGFSPLVEEGVSDLLDRKVRLSAGIVFGASPSFAPGSPQSFKRKAGYTSCGTGFRRRSSGFHGQAEYVDLVWKIAL